MKIEEAIKILHPDTTAEVIRKIEYYGGFRGKEKAIEAVNEASIVACEALEKQIPKKPKLVTRANGIIKFYPCPCCSTPEEYTLVYPRQNYCPKCGQAIDWKVEE